MRAHILDSRDEGNARCDLCRISLDEYVKGLPSTYQDYEIQREIVSNVYLDHLVDTVMAFRHIPPIVLVVPPKGHNREGRDLVVKDFKILDGLQRTFRLKAIHSTLEFSRGLKNPSQYLQWSKFKLSRQFSEKLTALNSSTEVLLRILDNRVRRGSAVDESFSRNKQWFEVWSGLTPDEEVRKMLTLNAGHKPVKTRHQLELLFLNLLPILRTGGGEGFDLVREKDIASAQFSKQRRPGAFHFAHVLAALLSLHAGKPLTPTTGLIRDIQGEDSIEEYSDFTNADFLKAFVSFLVAFDKQLHDQYGEIGVLWMGRETTLAGLFGALGANASEQEQPASKSMKELLKVTRANPRVLALDRYEKERNSLDLSKVNIGNVNRVAVFRAVSDILTNDPKSVNWRVHFGVEAT